GRELRPLDLTVGGDPSSACFWAAASVMQDRRVRIRNVLLNPTRMGFAEVLKRMGAPVTTAVESKAGGEDVGTVDIGGAGSSLRATEVKPHEIPTLIDEVPMLAIASLWARGTTAFRGVQELRVKESDRLEAVISFIAEIGGRAWAEGNDLFVEGLGGRPAGPKSSEWTYETLGDHRLAMASIVTADALRKEIVLDDAECIKVSYPGFFGHREVLAK
ncbi:MAG: 3-phosphoshikimate 1-carboxyvinyltransferase, partial [Deltaproteobacteria bacterium]|nr:3-phosphoshikimate 1-carboxyvinyltransferase [Deltaproteobacteria bacterium]